MMIGSDQVLRMAHEIKAENDLLQYKTLRNKYNNMRKRNKVNTTNT